MRDALKGVRVLDLTMNLPGPFMTWLMAEMGAEILKVENPEGGDFARAFSDPGQDVYFPVFDTVNRGKKSVTLDLKQPEGRDAFLRLLKDYDIVVEGFRPGIMEKLGIDYETVRRKYPGVIYVSISGYGQHGRYAGKGGHDINYQALAGSFDTGETPGPAPSVPTVPVADLGGGSLFALSGLLAAVIQRGNTGKGRHLDISLLDGAFALNVFAFCQMRRNHRFRRSDGHFLSGNQPFYHIYETRDGRHMALGAVEPKFWREFCSAVGREDLVARQFGGDAVIREVAEVFRRRSLADWIGLFRDIDACCEPVLTVREAMDSELGRERRLTGKSRDGAVIPTCPIKTPEQPMSALPEAPALGANNREILELSGLSGHPADRDGTD